MENPNDYRVGDKVIVGPLEYLQWGANEGRKTTYGSSLKEIAGTRGVISIDGTYYPWRVRSKHWCHWLPEWMFTHDFKWGQEIEVRDFAEWRWAKSTPEFRGYAWGAHGPFNASDCRWRYARPIREEKPEKAKAETLTTEQKLERIREICDS